MLSACVHSSCTVCILVAAKFQSRNELCLQLYACFLLDVPWPALEIGADSPPLAQARMGRCGLRNVPFHYGIETHYSQGVINHT